MPVCRPRQQQKIEMRTLTLKRGDTEGETTWNNCGRIELKIKKTIRITPVCVDDPITDLIGHGKEGSV